MDYKLNSVQQLVSNLLAKYRCMTAVQLTHFLYGEDITTSNEKYVYAQLKKLEEQKLVKRFKPTADISKHAIFYLNRKGLDYYHWVNEIVEGDIGEGWANTDCKLGYFPYEVYSPPLKQLKHHLMLINCFLQLHYECILHRNNLHAKRVVKLPNVRASILKPDGEMNINGERYAIEIDTGTESHKQLTMKFRHYFEYEAEYRELYRLNDSKGEQYDLDGIVFVVQDAPSGHLQRRWENVLAAYHKSLRGLHDKFKLYFVPISKFRKFIKLEESKFEYSVDIIQYLREYVFYSSEKDLSNLHVEKVSMREFSPEEIYTTMAFHTYSTPFSNSHAYALKEMNDVQKCWINPASTEIYLPDLSRYDVDPAILKIYEDAADVELNLM